MLLMSLCRFASAVAVGFQLTLFFEDGPRSPLALIALMFVGQPARRRTLLAAFLTVLVPAPISFQGVPISLRAAQM